MGLDDVSEEAGVTPAPALLEAPVTPVLLAAPVPVAAWRHAGISRPGTSHGASGIPCQDHQRCEVYQAADGNEVLLAVASDGAGSASRSEKGSSLVCTILIEQMRLFVEHVMSNNGNFSEFGKGDADEWLLAAVRAVETQAAAEGLPARELAATCVACLVTKDAFIGVQVGDGALVVDDGADGYEPVIWPMRGEFANETVFLYQESALAAAEVRVIPRTVRDLAVFTDGIQMVALHYETRTAPASFFKPLSGFMAQQPAGRSDLLDEALGDFLDRPSILARTDDDRTLILGCRR